MCMHVQQRLRICLCPQSGLTKLLHLTLQMVLSNRLPPFPLHSVHYFCLLFHKSMRACVLKYVRICTPLRTSPNSIAASSRVHLSQQTDNAQSPTLFSCLRLQCPTQFATSRPHPLKPSQYTRYPKTELLHIKSTHPSPVFFLVHFSP